SEALAVPLDLAEIESVPAAARMVLDHWDRIATLVKTPGHCPSRPPWAMPPFEDLPAAEWRPFLRAHTEGPYAAIQAVLPSMRALGWGRIVNVSPGVAVDGVPGAGPSAAAKAA